MNLTGKERIPILGVSRVDHHQAIVGLDQVGGYRQRPDVVDRPVDPFWLRQAVPLVIEVVPETEIRLECHAPPALLT